MTVNEFDLSGKVALITGGNGGIGLGFAESIAKAGGDVCIWGTNEDKNQQALEKLQAYGTKITALKCDVSDEVAVNESFAATLASHGRVDGCFANAGVSGRSMKEGKPIDFADMETEEWKRVIGVNLDGAFYTFRAAAKHMRDRGDGGRLVGTASLAAVSGQARGQHYAATKGGAGLHDLCPGGGNGALQGHRQRDPSRLDRNRHDRADLWLG